MKKSLVITLIIVLIIIAGFLVSFMFSVIGGHRWFNIRSKTSNTLVVDKTYDNDFDEIFVNTDMSTTEIKVSNDNIFRVVVYADQDETTYSDEFGILRVETKAKKCFGFCFNQESSKVEIYVPESFDGKMELKNSYGDIKVGEFGNANITIDEDCGDVKVEAAKIVDIKNDYGDIFLDYAEDAKIDDSCGNINIGEVRNLTIKNDYGDIEIDKVTNYIDADDSCGNISVREITLDRNSRIKNDLGDIKIGNTNEIYIDASVELGDIEIRNNYRESFVTLVIQNNCGNIKVEN